MVRMRRPKRERRHCPVRGARQERVRSCGQHEPKSFFCGPPGGVVAGCRRSGRGDDGRPRGSSAGWRRRTRARGETSAGAPAAERTTKPGGRQSWLVAGALGGEGPCGGRWCGICGGSSGGSSGGNLALKFGTLALDASGCHGTAPDGVRSRSMPDPAGQRHACSLPSPRHSAENNARPATRCSRPFFDVVAARFFCDPGEWVR